MEDHHLDLTLEKGRIERTNTSVPNSYLKDCLGHGNLQIKTYILECLATHIFVEYAISRSPSEVFTVRLPVSLLGRKAI